MIKHLGLGLALALGGFASASPAGAPPTAQSTPPVQSVDDEDDGPKWSYCAYFGPNSTHHSHCSRKPLPEAQTDCDELLKRKKIEGTCDCTDNQNFIGDRCR